MVMATTAKQLRRVRTLGRGASGAVVWLASDEASGELLAVKSACASGAAALLQREGRVLQGLSSPHIVPCLGSRAAAGGEYQLFLEFAPGGSLADEAARRASGRLPERDIRAYAGDVARGLAYLHGLSLVHGDVKARNVVIGGDGRARLTDFGCARPVSSARPVGGTPAFMAPEVARGQEQGPAADVWALGCLVVEMATGRAPWSDMGGGDDLLAAIHRIGYTDAVPEVPAWLSAEAKDFLARCFQRRASARSTAAQLVAHPFVANSSAARDLEDDDARPAKKQQQEFPSSLPSPRSTLLHDAFWDSDTEDEADDEMSTGAAQRIGALAGAASALPDWDSEEGWIDLQDDRHSETVDAPPQAATAAVADYFVWAEPSDAAAELEQHQFAAAAADDSVHLHLPAHVAGAAVAGGTATTTISQQGSSYMPTIFMHLDVHEKEILRPLDHDDDDGLQKVESHRACNNRNRVTTAMKRISLKISLLEITWLARPVAPVHHHHHVLMPKRNVRSRNSRKRKKSSLLSTTPLAVELVCVDGDHITFPGVASLVSKVGRSFRRAVSPYGHAGWMRANRMRARRRRASMTSCLHMLVVLHCGSMFCSSMSEWTSLVYGMSTPRFSIRCDAAASPSAHAALF